MSNKFVSVTVALVGAGSLLTGCNFEQPDAGCIVQDASFANWVAKYELKNPESVPASCQARLTIGNGATFGGGGEQWGVFKFVDPDKAGSSVLTIRPAGLYSRAALDICDADTQARLLKAAEGQTATEVQALKDALARECTPDEGQSTYAQTAVGSLAEEVGSDDFCTTSAWKSGWVEPRPTGQLNPDVPPTTTISYLFDNVKVYAAPSAPGTQLSADLKYTRDECTAEFKVRAIWPAVPCNPNSQRASERCGDRSGINPNFAVVCDTSFRISNAVDDNGAFVYPGTCVAEKEIPSFK